MITLSKAQGAIQALGLVQGLPIEEVHRRLAASLRLGDVGQRGIAFYLHDMAARNESGTSGHRSAVFYAETRLGLTRRRARELIYAGQRLLELTEVDRAFCEDQIGWSKVLQIVNVAIPDCQEEWLAAAREMTCRELAAEVKRSPYGQAPRRRNRRSIHDVLYDVSVRVNAMTRELLRRAKEKLSAELGRPVGDEEFLHTLASLQLSFDDDGTIPGHTRSSCSHFQIVLRPEDIDRAGNAPLVVDTADGPIPLDPSDGEHGNVIGGTMWCDAEVVVVGDYDVGGEHYELDKKTPAPLRAKVLARDDHRCRCCGSRHDVQVHHIAFRSKQGRTIAFNLISACIDCHSLVHANLLVIQGHDAEHVRFLDAAGQPLHEPDRFVDPSLLLELRLPRAGIDTDERAKPADAPASTFVTLDDLPAVVDGAWWRRHLDLIRFRAGKGLEFRSGTPLPGGEAQRATVTEVKGEPFAGLVGQDALVERLEVLYQAVSERALDLRLQEGARSRSVRLELPPFTLLAATTEGGRLPPPLRSRFGVHECLGRYDASDLAELATQAAAEERVTIEPEAGHKLAACALGTPRETLRLKDRVVTQALVHKWTVVDPEAMDEFLALLGYDQNGLGPVAQRYLAELYASDGPVSLARLSRAVGMDPRSVERDVEPDLLRRGLVRITLGGRVAVHPLKAQVMGPNPANVRQLWSRVPLALPPRVAGGE